MPDNNPLDNIGQALSGLGQAKDQFLQSEPVQGIENAVGGAVQGVFGNPVVAAGMRVLNAPLNALNLVTIHADEVIPGVGQGTLYNRYQKYLNEDGLGWDEAAQATMSDYGKAAQQLAESPNADMASRVVSQLSRVAGTAQAFAAPIPPIGKGIGLLRGLGREAPNLAEQALAEGGRTAGEAAFQGAESGLRNRLGLSPDAYAADNEAILRSRGVSFEPGTGGAIRQSRPRLQRATTIGEAAAEPETRAGGALKMLGGEGTVPPIAGGEDIAKQQAAEEAQKAFGTIEGTVPTPGPVEPAVARATARANRAAQGQLLNKAAEAYKAGDTPAFIQISTELNTKYGQTPANILETMYRRGVISNFDYEAAKTKIAVDTQESVVAQGAKTATDEANARLAQGGTRQPGLTQPTTTPAAASRRTAKKAKAVQQAQGNVPVTPPAPRPEVGSSFMSVAGSLWNLPRALLATLDNSFGLRQGVYFLPSHPGAWMHAEKASFGALGSENIANAYTKEIQNSKYFNIMQDSGVEFGSDGLRKAGLGQREEPFMTEFAGKLPGIKQANRAYTTGADVLRTKVFEDIAGSWEKSGIKATENDYKALASLVNYGTGRGSLGVAKELGPALNGLFFAPRFLISRVQVAAAPAIFAKTSPLVAKEAAGDLVKFVGSGSVVLGLLKTALEKNNAGSVEVDPRSSNFGKIVIGDNHYDIWGGFQPIARYTAQLITGQGKTLQGDIVARDPWTTLGQFARSKLAPFPATINDLRLGHDLLGNPVTLMSVVKGLAAPLSANDVISAAVQEQQQGGNAIAGAAAAVPSLLGVGYQKFEETHQVFDPHGVTAPGGRIKDIPFVGPMAGPLGQAPVGDFFQKPPTNDPVEAELQTLRAPGGFDDKGKPLPAKQLTISFEKGDFPTKEKYPLTGDEERLYQQDAGGRAYQAIQGLFSGQTQISGKFYADMSMDERVKAVQKLVSDSKAQSKVTVALGALQKAQTLESQQRALEIGMASSGTNYEKADLMTKAVQMNAMTPELSNYWNAKAATTKDLSVSDLVKGKQLIDAYNSAPPHTIGTPADWQAAALAAQQLRELRKGKTALQIKQDANITKFYASAANQWLRYFYQRDGSINASRLSQARQAIRKNALLAKFSSNIEGE